jgi:hypothetical protein
MKLVRDFSFVKDSRDVRRALKRIDMDVAELGAVVWIDGDMSGREICEAFGLSVGRFRGAVSRIRAAA